jgi:hypothetical protein
MRVGYEMNIILGAISIVESGNNDMAVGDRRCPDGPAIGRFQIHQSAWLDIDKLRRAKCLPVHPYHDAHKASVARAYANTLVEAIIEQFVKSHLAKPSPALIYACYSLGPSIVPKIRNMAGLKIVGTSEFSLVVCNNMEATLWSIGYTTSLSRRKAKQSDRYEKLVLAHYISMRDLGIPLIL